MRGTKSQSSLVKPCRRQISHNSRKFYLNILSKSINNLGNKNYLPFCDSIVDDDPDCSKMETSRNAGRAYLTHADFNGYVTDFNIWSRTLSIPEMKTWTTCQSFEKGNLLAWNPNDWTPSQLFSDGSPVTVHSEVQVNSDAFCPSTSPNGRTYTLFTDHFFTHAEGFLLCKQFSGDMAHTRTMEESIIVNDFINTVWDKHDIKPKGVYYRYTDVAENGVWVDPETGFVASNMKCPDNPDDCDGVIQWSIHEPEGGDAENCAGGIQKVGGLESNGYDIRCTVKHSIVCEDISSDLVLRGLCPLSKFGKRYMMSPNYLDERRFFNGYTGWKLSYENDVWSLRHPSILDTYANYGESKHYPMGRKTWQVTNDVCSGNEC